MSETSKYTIHTQSNQMIEKNYGTVIGIQNSYLDPKVQGAISDLKTLLIQLQIQYPQVVTESAQTSQITTRWSRPTKGYL